MKTWHISDTHGLHQEFKVPEGIDLVIHSGDAESSRGVETNEIEFEDFCDWFFDLKIPHKIYVPGNHSTWVAENQQKAKEYCATNGVQFLSNESLILGGKKFWGSPWTPVYHDWAFNGDRIQLQEIWKTIPDDTDYLITHGPPFGILDLALSEDSRYVEQAGCFLLRQRTLELKNLKAHFFGHMHSSARFNNHGVFCPALSSPWFSNGSCAYYNGKKFVLIANGTITDLGTEVV